MEVWWENETISVLGSLFSTSEEEGLVSSPMFQEHVKRGSNKIMMWGQGMEEEWQEKWRHVSGVDEESIWTAQEAEQAIYMFTWVLYFLEVTQYYIAKYSLLL